MFHLSYDGGGHFGHIVKKPSTVSPPRIAVELVAAFPARPGGSSGRKIAEQGKISPRLVDIYVHIQYIYINIIEKKMSTCESQSGQKDWKRHYSRALLKELLNLHDLVCLTSNTSHLFAFYFFRLSRWIYWYNNQIDITVFVYINIYV